MGFVFLFFTKVLLHQNNSINRKTWMLHLLLLAFDVGSNENRTIIYSKQQWYYSTAALLYCTVQESVIWLMIQYWAIKKWGPVSMCTGNIQFMVMTQLVGTFSSFIGKLNQIRQIWFFPSHIFFFRSLKCVEIYWPSCLYIFTIWSYCSVLVTTSC